MTHTTTKVTKMEAMPYQQQKRTKMLSKKLVKMQLGKNLYEHKTHKKRMTAKTLKKTRGWIKRKKSVTCAAERQESEGELCRTYLENTLLVLFGIEEDQGITYTHLQSRT